MSGVVRKGTVLGETPEKVFQDERFLSERCAHMKLLCRAWQAEATHSG